MTVLLFTRFGQKTIFFKKWAFFGTGGKWHLRHFLAAARPK